MRQKGRRATRAEDAGTPINPVAVGVEKRKKPVIAPSDWAVFAIEDGQVLINMKSGSEAKEGDLVQLYADDHLIGSGFTQKQPRGEGLVCAVAVDHAPAIAFPAAIRALLPRSHGEISPGLTVSSIAELQRKMGRHGLEIQLSLVQDTAIGFNVAVSCLPVFSRSLTLHLGGRTPAKAKSVVPSYNGQPMALVHTVVFTIEAAVRDGMSIEVIDDATDTVVFDSTLTWMNLINPVLAELRAMHQEQDALTARLDLMRKQIMASTDPGRERMFLQRLDLTYLLLNERLDRELKWLSKRIDSAGGEQVAVEHLSANVPGAAQLSPGNLQGVGIYDSESNGSTTWRWFSRTVTLFLTEIDPDVRALRFSFALGSPAIDLTRMSVSANGFDSPFEWMYPDERVELLIMLSSMAVRLDGTLILTIDFGQGWNAENDSRILTFACIGLGIET